MKLLDSFITALKALATNKLRSSLTMIGLVVGVGAVIILMSLGRGVQASISSQISEMGTDMLTVSAGKTASTFQYPFAGALTWEDALAMERSVDAPAIKVVTPYTFGYSEVVAGRENKVTEVFGVTPNFLDQVKYKIEKGAFINKGHMDSRASVIVLGYDVAESLFKNANPIGQYVKISGIKLKVIGVSEKKGTMLGMSLDNVVAIPLTTVISRLSTQRTARGEHSIAGMYVRAASTEQVADARAQITDVLRKRHHIRPGDDNDFNISTVGDLMKTMGTITGILTMFLASIAAISLVVGGVGVMNIMLVSVKDRTKEIGLRKAVGAKRRDILMQFLIESATLSLTGGSIGLLLGWVIARIVSVFGKGVGISAVFSPDIIILAFSVAVGVGLFFGVYPASRAARLDPIEALRYE